jgi:tetratricopeptide (TPR) repeat protein
MKRKSTSTDILRAQSLNRTGLEHFERWELESAITLFQEAARLNDQEAEYHLNLARAQVRMGDYEHMLRALGNYLRTETDRAMIERFETLFTNALDNVESRLTTVMPQQGLPLEIVGSAIQMWVEFRVTLGKAPLDLSRPEDWAAALDYSVRKVNYAEAPLAEIAGWYGANETGIRNHHHEMVKALDNMPCDYRYFRGEENPLDKLVEAAMMLEDLEAKFQAL